MIIYNKIIVLNRPKFHEQFSPGRLAIIGWITSTYQRDTKPRDYQECSQVQEPRVRGCRFLGVVYQSPTSVGTFNPLITQLSSVLRSLKLVRESSCFPPFISLYSLLQGVDEVVKPLLSFPSLDNRTLVDQQLTFRVVHLLFWEGS
ncbi:hypothetical protein AVEN_103986-1 [Araneus ventricosus]|uniref:Uncharacterized protein n=1 Tax=Araneus ventricosus TaxID=182803 RepID=A0A4Y2XBI7_ARAVE|nr:hypothetical protein AVEN_103986-1 [Araneus ventricosus]